MKTIRQIFLLSSSVFLLQSGAIYGSNPIIVGRITDHRQIPIPYVEVYLPGQGVGTTTGRDGRFLLAYDSASNTHMRISHSAYEAIEISLDTVQTGILEVSLSPKTYYFDPVTVEGNLYGKEKLSLPVSHQIISFARSPGWGNSLGERLDRMGIQVKDYGGPAGLKTVASPTGYGEHVLVMLEGLPLNSPQWGGLDFSVFPADIFKQGEFYFGHGSSLYGSNAVGGTLNLLLDRFQPSYVRVKSGSFGERSVGGRVSIHPGSANLSIYDSQYESVGNFRENNKFVQDSYALNASVPLGKLWTGTYFSLWSKADRGIAGSTVYPSPAAGKTNDDWIHLLTVRGLSNWGRSEISLGLTGSREHYTNPDWSVNSRHRVSTRRLRALHRFLQRGPFQHTAVLEIIQHHVDSDDAGNHQELMGAIGILSQVRLKSTFLLSGSTRTGWNLQRGTFVVNGSLGLVWQGNLQVLRSILFNAGTSYRNPTFNDLYWEDPFGYSQGSPDLRPERGTSAHAGVELWPLGFESLQVRATAYHFFTNDLIQWIPGVDFVYSPRNLSKTKSYGVMLTAALLPEKFPIRGAITTDQNRSRLLDDGANGGKRLLYVPAVSHWAELTWATRLVDLNISYRFLGQRRYSYVGESVLKAYDRLDLSLTGHVPPVYGFQPTIVLGVRNVQNRVGQQSVYGYPEPERALFSTLTVALP